MRLIPRDEKYFSLLNDLVGEIRNGAETFVRLFEDFPKHAEYAEQIKAIERECDKKAAGIVDRLNSSFITPLDREDLYLLAAELDDVMDKINEMARLTVLYGIKETRPEARSLSTILRDSVVELGNAFASLEGRKDVREAIARIKQLEEDGDAASQGAVQRLFAEETNPIEVIKWLKIYEDMEAGIDRCKDVAKVLETIVMKNA